MEVKMKTPGQLRECIQRFQEAFWDKGPTDRPPVGVTDDHSWMPINNLHQPFPRSEVRPVDVNSQTCLTDYANFFASRHISCDDLIPYSAPWRAVPWVEAACGCGVRYSTGSLAPDRYVKSTADLQDITLPANVEWLECMCRQLRDLRADAAADCWIVPGIMRGPSDVLGAMCGLEEFYCALLTDPGPLGQAAARINRLLVDMIDMHYSLVQPKMGGYGHAYGYWAPDKTFVLQEDAMGQCSPAHYRDLFMQHNADIVRHLGPYVLFHLHSTGYHHYRDILQLPGLAGLEVSIEQDGPSLLDMLPDLQNILEQSRIILYVEHYYDQLPRVLRRLPKSGLYLLVSERYIHTEEEFTQFVTSTW